MKKKTTKGKWFYLPEEYWLQEKGGKGWMPTYLPVVVLYNDETGEVKLYTKKKADEVGRSNLF